MADLRDIALEIAARLQAEKEPDPLSLDLWHRAPESAAYLVLMVIEECSDAGIALARVRIDGYVAAAMRRSSTGCLWSYRNTFIEVDPALFQRAEFHRHEREPCAWSWRKASGERTSRLVKKREK